jgi:hypothetical protein
VGGGMTERIDNLTPNLFLDGPTEFLVKRIASEIEKVPQFKKLFGDNIDPYEREDYSERALPALRIYNTQYTKEAESWFINGEIKMDVILPASLRRTNLQQVQDTIASALLQQFRRQTFFDKLDEAYVPGLNELGKVFSVNKEMGFNWGDFIVPVTQISANFRLDLRIWDLHLTAEGRTKDDPFEVTLRPLERIISTIEALNSDGSIAVDVGIQNTV